MRTRWIGLGLALLFSTLSVAGNKPAYQYFRVGNANDVTTPVTAGIVLEGGGTDVDAAYQWMCARSGGGDFLVIRATGTDAYNPYIQGLCPSENSVATLIIPNTTAANDPFVANTINTAEAIFIAGGNQADYINFWTGTPVETALNNAIARGVPVGGTSAGMNVLTKFIYTALLPQGVTSSQALANPYTKYITLGENFVNIAALPAMIGDPHFVTRDRMGRDLAFYCRIWANNWSSAPRGVAVDEQTALLVDGSGNATIVGVSTAYFLQAPGGPQVCAAGTRRAASVRCRHSADIPEHCGVPDQRDGHAGADVQLLHVEGHGRDRLYRVGQCGRAEFDAGRREHLLSFR